MMLRPRRSSSPRRPAANRTDECTRSVPQQISCLANRTDLALAQQINKSPVLCSSSGTLLVLRRSSSTMAFQSAFRERLRDMDNSRKQRFSLLQAEKDLQTNKSLLLSAKLAQIRSLEQRCLLLDHKLASQNFKISSLKSEIEFLDRKYQKCANQFRDLKIEVEELEQLEEEREKCYSVNCSEMQEFKDGAEKFAAQIRSQVEELKRRRDELKSSYFEFHKQNPDIQAAEMRKSELLSLQKKVTSSMESNNRLKAALEKQLQSLR